MATEKNPFEQLRPAAENIIQLPSQTEQPQTGDPTFELEDDGGLTVDFSSTEENTEMGASTEIGEWYGNLASTIDEDLLEDIGNNVYENFIADKDSRSEWESMFERGFDLLGLKIQETTEPFEGACTAVHPLLIESAVKFQSKASQELFPSKGPVKALSLIHI